MNDFVTRSKHAVVAAPPGPTFDALRASVRRLAGLVEASADAAERNGELTPEVEAALREGSFAGMWTPAALGGSELTVPQGMELVEDISYLDGSAGWVVMAHAACTACAAGYLGDSAVAELFADGPPRISGQGIPNGKAVPCDGGYVLSGTWSYGSGIRNGDWVHTDAVIHESGEPRLRENGLRDAIILNVPRDKVIFGDNWDVIGLQATGSIDYSIDDVFVPEQYVQAFDAATPVRGGPIFYLGVHGMGAIVHTAFALGVGRRILDELRELARGGRGRLVASAGDSFYERFGAAEAKLVFSRAAAYRTIDELQETFDRGEVPSVRQKTFLRLLVHHVTWAVVDIASFAFEESGGVGLRAGKLQRCFRDLRAGAQHAMVSRAPLRLAGMEVAGAAEGKVWSGYNLVDPL